VAPWDEDEDDGYSANGPGWLVRRANYAAPMEEEMTTLPWAFPASK